MFLSATPFDVNLNSRDDSPDILGKVFVMYSRVSNKRRPPNKRRPWKKLAKTINVDP